MSWAALALHAVLMAAAVPVLAGASGWVAARVRGVAPPPVWQAWRDLVRLWRKSGVRPAGASLVFAGAPSASLAAACVAVVLVPSFGLGMATAPWADLVVVAGLLALSRAALALAAYDAGWAAEAQAGGRAMAARLGVAPVLLLVALELWLVSGGTNLDAAVAAVRDGGPGARLGGALAGAALFLSALGGGDGVLPPFAGRQRAVAVAAGHVRRVVVLSMAGALLLPVGVAAAGAGVLGWGFGLVCWVAKMGVLGGLEAAAGPWRPALAVAALLVLIAVALGGVQGAA